MWYSQRLLLEAVLDDCEDATLDTELTLLAEDVSEDELEEELLELLCPLRDSKYCRSHCNAGRSVPSARNR